MENTQVTPVLSFNNFHKKSEDVKRALNSMLDDFFLAKGRNYCTPFVCICCDKFIKRSEVKVITERTLKKVKEVLTCRSSS